MKTVESVFAEFTDYRKIMAELRNLLSEIDPEYEKEEASFKKGVKTLLQVLPQERKLLAQDLLEKQEQAVVAHLIFLVWGGIMQNLECFRNPISKRFLDLDYEDIHKETAMQDMPVSRVYWQTADKYHHSATEDEHRLYDDITSYYCYLDTVANKIAHYYGFLLGNKLLPHVVPNYGTDVATTIQYGLALSDYLGMPVQKIEK